MAITKKTAVLLINTGSPERADAPAVREYLAEFLGDQRIVELPRWKWWPILHGIVLRVRPKKSAELYRHIWTKEGSPLIENTRRVAQALEKAFVGTPLEGVRVFWSMRYGKPSVAEVYEAMKAEGIERLLVFPHFAQYCPHTSVSCVDAVYKVALKERSFPQCRVLEDYYIHPAYIEALRASVTRYWETHPSAISMGGKLLMSFHSVPMAGVEKGDVYRDRCYATAKALQRALGLKDDQVEVSFQSRFGRDPWVEPFSIDRATALAREGVPLDVMCPGFACDCLESLEEIGLSLAQTYRENYQGDKPVHYAYIPALNDSPEAIQAYRTIMQEELAGWV